MSHYYPEGTPPVVMHTSARIERQLVVPGEILVRVGSRVEPDDVVIRAAYPLGPYVVNVARELSVLPSNVYTKMKKEEGNKVARGEVIAKANIFSGRSVVAPVAGTISTIDRTTGYVTITPNPVPLELKAQVRGIVMEVPDQRTVVIETPASYVQGIFGVGGERFGVLHLLVTDPRERVDVDAITSRTTYAILIGGASITAAALRKAVEEQVRGIIVGGIEEHELRDFLGDSAGEAWQTGYDTWRLPAPPFNRDPGLTLMVTEGFGVHPMSDPLYQMLASYDQQEALIEGATQLRQPQRRPRLIVPLSRVRNIDEAQRERLQLKVNSTVRILAGEHQGKIGTIRSVPTTPRTLPSGVVTPAVEVALADGTSVLLPHAALDAM